MDTPYFSWTAPNWKREESDGVRGGGEGGLARINFAQNGNFGEAFLSITREIFANSLVVQKTGSVTNIWATHDMTRKSVVDGDT